MSNVTEQFTKLTLKDRNTPNGPEMMCEEERMCKDISLDNVMNYLELAQENDLSQLKLACLDYISQPKNITLLFLTREYTGVVVKYPFFLPELHLASLQVEA